MTVEQKFLTESKSDCCGCAACQYICPVDAITMRSDSEGFSYPDVNIDGCIGCNKCIRLCSFKNDIQTLKYINDKSSPDCYAAVHKNLDVCRNSRSGGIFTALSDYILQNNGVIYGAITTYPDMTVIHRRAENELDRNLMRGSKYVQSDISDCFSLIKKDLAAGRLVLFTGTSCQVAAIKTAMGDKHPNLFTVDIVCHGVPSPRIWKDYVSYIQKKYGAVCVDVDFRNKKKFGWTACIESFKLRKGNRVKDVDSLYYTKLYHSHLIIRPSCSSCPYKCKKHPGDITIADYWGIKKAAPEFFNEMGVSLLLVNSERGNTLFEHVKEAINYKKTELYKSMQPALQAPFPMPENRKDFWSDYEKMGIEKVLLKYVGNKKELDASIRKQRLLFVMKTIKKKMMVKIHNADIE